MKKNVNTIDALMRITLGLTGVAWGTAQMIRQPYRVTPLVVTMASAMKVAEGITRYCPMLALFKMDSEEIGEEMAQMAKSSKRMVRKAADQMEDMFQKDDDRYPPIN
jgi:hypothetical protein